MIFSAESGIVTKTVPPNSLEFLCHAMSDPSADSFKRAASITVNIP